MVATKLTPEQKMDEQEAIKEMYRRCFPFDIARTEELLKSGTKLAHYTTAENGLNIIQSKTFWLRNAALMNDFSEIEHGRLCFAYVIQETDLFNRLSGAIEPHHASLCDEVLKWLDDADLDARLFTYMTAVSEHAVDDEIGRLSMWRAYGGNVAGIALVLNTDFLQSEATSLESATSPVHYGGPAEFASEMRQLVEALEGAPELVSAVPRENVKAILFNAFRYAILSTKHQGFSEEREWRVLHSPRRASSDFVEPLVTSIRGIPQLVYRIPLEDRPGLGMPELELDRLLHRVIIGPTQYPFQIAEAYDEAMQRAGVQNAGERIKISRIPLRHLG
jgi:hypothetical protein